MTATTLLTLLAIAAAGARGPRSTRVVVPQAAERPPTVFKVQGEGKTLEDAQEAALEKARARLIDELRQLRPSLCWEPDLRYLRELRDNGLIRVADRYEFNSERLGTLQGVEIEVSVTDSHMKKMLALDRNERQRDRHVQTLKVLGALLALGFLFASYARLEEVCRGFFSGLLKIGLLAGVAVVGAGLWWML